MCELKQRYHDLVTITGSRRSKKLIEECTIMFHGIHFQRSGAVLFFHVLSMYLSTLHPEIHNKGWSKQAIPDTTSGNKPTQIWIPPVSQQMPQPRTNNLGAPRRTSATPSMMAKCKWRTSKAKLILVADLESKLLPLHETEMSAEVAWNKIYKDLPEFKDIVTFDQFRKYLNDHRKQVKKTFTHTEIQEEALAHDRKLYRRKTHNDRGELVFDFSTAKALLQLDVKNKLHTFLSLSELQATRPEYGLFKKSKFKERIVQEVRRQNFSIT